MNNYTRLHCIFALFFPYWLIAQNPSEKVITLEKQLTNAVADSTKINLLLQIGQIHTENLDSLSAIKAYQKAINLSEPQYKQKRIQSLLGLGDLYRKLGQEKTALDEFYKIANEASEFYKEQGEAYLNLASIYKNWGESDKSFQNSQNAFKLFEKHKDYFGMLRAMNMQVIVYTSLNEFDKTIALLEKMEVIGA